MRTQIRFPLFVSLVLFALLGVGCMKHEMDMNMKMDSPYMKIMMDMMTQMDAQVKTQDPDHDFAAQMVLHHDAAIKMAQEELKSGTNSEMRTTAQTIITKQQAEITQFNSFLNGHQPQQPTVPAFNQAQKTNMDKMMKDSEARMLRNKADYDFAQLMIDHHQAAIDNSQAELQYGRNNTTKTLAQNIIDDQRMEIAALQNWLSRNN